MCHPQHQHQEPKGVGHVPPRGLGEHSHGKMGYQEICEYPQKNIFLLLGVCHPQHQHQGPKGLGHVPPQGLGEHSQEKMRYQQIFWDSQVKNFLWVGILTTPAPGTKRCRPCASWRPWGALTGAIEVSTDLLGLPDEKIIDSWMSHP